MSLTASGVSQAETIVVNIDDEIQGTHPCSTYCDGAFRVVVACEDAQAVCHASELFKSLEERLSDAMKLEQATRRQWLLREGVTLPV